MTTSRVWICVAWTRRPPSRPICRRMVREKPISQNSAAIEFKRQFPELRNHTVTPENGNKL